MIILGVTLSSRFNSVLSFSSMAIRTQQHAKTTTGLRTLPSLATTSTALRGKTSDEDARRSVKNNGNNNLGKQKKSTVAIIGGGIAGLSCARHLQHSYDVTVVSANQFVPLHIVQCRLTEEKKLMYKTRFRDQKLTSCFWRRPSLFNSLLPHVYTPPNIVV